MRSGFMATILLVAAGEIMLLAWPVVATVIWRKSAFLTWIHFIFLLRVLLLLCSIFRVRYPHRLYGTGEYSAGLWNVLRLHGAFATYSSLAWWMRWAFVHGIMLTGLFVLATLATLPLFMAHENHGHHSMLPWGLTLGFHVLIMVQSWLSVYIVWKLGVQRPILAAYTQARKANVVEVTPRVLRDTESTMRQRKMRENMKKFGVTHV